MPRSHDGRSPIEHPGFSYLPRFIDDAESAALIEYFGAIKPLWERRHVEGNHLRGDGHSRRLTRPVYWLGAWQFACLGYYAEPDHREHRCVSAEPFPDVMRQILERLVDVLLERHSEPEAAGSASAPGPRAVLPNTCLINYYGREIGEGPPVDYARLRMHRDGEPGPVVMFNIGQPGLLEFLDPARGDIPELAVWTRHRSITIMSGPEYKDRLYHRVSRTRMGNEPELHCRVPGFELRRVSVSFRHVPDALIDDFGDLPAERQAMVREYVEELARESEHFAAQLASLQ